jgi:hypothetical protein
LASRERQRPGRLAFQLLRREAEELVGMKKQKE